MMSYAIQTIDDQNTCTLRTFVYEDAATILSWCKNKYEFRLWSADRYSAYPAHPDEMLKQYSSVNMHPLTMVESGKIIGHILLRYPTENKDIIRFGFIIVSDALRGRGYGKKLLQLAAQYAKDKLCAKKITLGVFCDNLSALECYKSAGFSIIGYDSYPIDGEDWKEAEMEWVLE